MEDVKFVDMGWYLPAGGDHGIHVLVGNKKDFHVVGERRIESLIKDMGLKVFMQKILECNRNRLSEQYDQLKMEFDRQSTIKELFVREIQHLRDHLTGVSKAGGKWELQILQTIHYLEEAYERVGKEGEE